MGSEKFLAILMIPLVMHSGTKQHIYKRGLNYLMASEGFSSIHFNIRTFKARSLSTLACEWEECLKRWGHCEGCGENDSCKCNSNMTV